MPIPRPTLSYCAEVGVRDGSSTMAELGVGAVSTSRRLVILWAESQKFAQSFLGYSRIAGGRLERLLPAVHPFDPSLIPVKIGIERNHKFLKGLGREVTQPGSLTNTLSDGSVGSVYNKMLVKVDYQRAMFDLKEDADTPADQEYLRYVDWGVPEPAADVMTIPGHVLHYTLRPGDPAPLSFLGGTHRPIPFNVPLVQPSFVVRLRWCRLPASIYTPADPGPLVKRLVGDLTATPKKVAYHGTINKYQFGPYPPGTLLLLRWSMERRPAPFVEYVGTQNNPPAYTSPAVEFDVTYDCKFAPNGHNYVYMHDMPFGTTTGTQRSGYYYVSRSFTYHAPGTVPDYDSLFNERPFADLFSVA